MLFRRYPGIKTSENKYFATRTNVHERLFGGRRFSGMGICSIENYMARLTTSDHGACVSGYPKTDDRLPGAGCRGLRTQVRAAG